MSVEEAAARYTAMDFDWFQRDFRSGSVAEALQAMLRRTPEAPALLAGAIADLPEGETRDRLKGLALNGFRHRLDFAGYRRAADMLGEDRNPGIAFLVQAEPSLAMQGNVVEVDYADRRIPAIIDGEPIQIIVDTGAPGVGISRDIVERENLPISPGTGGNAVIPSLNLSYALDPTIIREVTIGDAVFRDIPAESGDLTQEQQAVLVQNDLASDMIVGLDFFAPFFDVIEFDQIEGKLRLIREVREAAAAPNFVMGSSRYPLVRVSVNGTPRTVIVDTGSGNNNLPAEWLSSGSCSGYREFERSWGSFGEYLIPLNFAAAGGVSDFWVSARDFGSDEVFGARGVFGAVNRGRLRIDLEDANIAWRDYDPALANYEFAASQVIEGVCPGL